MSRKRKRPPAKRVPARPERNHGLDRHPRKGSVENLAREETLVYQEHAGPLPAPWALRGYEEIQAGAAERIISMAEKQQAHGHFIEKSGQFLAFFVVMSGLVAGTYLLANDKSLLGAAVTLTPFVGLAGLFIWRRRGDRGPAVEAPAVPTKPGPPIQR